MGCDMTGKKLLIVEDDLALRHILTWDFEELGYQVHASGCYAEASDALKTDSFDLALLDYNLPDGVGLDLVASIRKKNPKLPVILYSGMICENNLKHNRLFQKVSFIPKPVTAGSLHKRFMSLNESN